MLDAIVEGVGTVEDDVLEMTVGRGGLPNEAGEVELDASVFDGPRHKAGAVAGLRQVRSAAAVALQVLRRTDHNLIVGDGALAFAKAMGFALEDLLTPEARAAFEAWKRDPRRPSAWLDATGQGGFGGARTAGRVDSRDGLDHAGVSATVRTTTGTIHVSGRDARGDLFACTSTSGLSYKIPGRVGDSAIPGHGIFVDNAFGSAGATGRGEASMLACAAYETVRNMETGMAPTQACLETLGRVVRRTVEARLLDAPGRPAFNVILYALRKDGAWGSASIHPGYEFVVHAQGVTRKLPSAAYLDEARQTGG
jgi:N4-(beta-N-acetylglucosaminyl)-L-asparaginase